ncbi:hypothetical protein [Vibrio sp. HA2012]|uniref:hypothetical protein n=1 Tax=Vibrio sp. HA2012 TaxID=1971595 RepID=UPI0012FD0CE0|nr:hypothetical protein [Vibrio sp. HA2012]
MTLQFAFLLTFIAGGVSVWICMRMSAQVKQERIDTIKKYIRSIGGNTLNIDLTDRKDCPFSSEYTNPDRVYKFYKIRYIADHEQKVCWAVLEMKQRSYGPGGAITTHWIWRN